MILDVKEILADGDMVVTLGIMELSFTTDLSGFPPATGQKVKFPYFDAMRIEKGKIVEEWQLWDTFSFNTQLGMVMTFQE